MEDWKQKDLLGDTRVLTPTGFKPLTREERAEAAKAAIEASFRLEDCQVVRREFFSHVYDPTLTIKGTSIVFNAACIRKLENVIYIQVLVNPTAEKLVIRPCGEDDRDAVRWCIPKEDKRRSREITCGLFTAKLYDMMGWETLYRYKLLGTKINYNGEQLYVFDLKSTEVFLPSVKNPNALDKPVKRRRVFPADWRDSFGIPFSEHEAAKGVNLVEGYTQFNLEGSLPAIEGEVTDNE